MPAEEFGLGGGMEGGGIDGLEEEGITGTVPYWPIGAYSSDFSSGT